MAKILLITSIPQDVFIASGATVKPSLLFFKKFTETEVNELKRIEAKAKKDIEEKYKPIEEKENTKYQTFVNGINSKILGKQIQPQIQKSKALISSKGLLDVIKASMQDYTKYGDLLAIEDYKKAIKEAKVIFINEMKRIQSLKETEIKAQIKKEFNYQIPIAEVEKAGISSTGSQIENELEPLAKEFKIYRENNKLWTTYTKEINYQIVDEEIGRVRIIDGVFSEPEVFYNKLKY